MSQDAGAGDDEEEEEVEAEEEDDDEEKDKLRINEDEEIFDMDNICQDEKPRTPTVSNPKSFVAVTSSDRIRKISVVKNDFKPIENPCIKYDTLSIDSSNSHLPLSSSSSSSSTKRNSKDESIADESKNSNLKRKRKRKSVMKRKGGTSRKNSNSLGNETDTISNPDKEAVIEAEKSCLDNSVSIFKS